MRTNFEHILVSFSKLSSQAFGGVNKILFITNKCFFACIDTINAKINYGASLVSAQMNLVDAPFWQSQFLGKPFFQETYQLVLQYNTNRLNNLNRLSGSHQLKSPISIDS